MRRRPFDRLLHDECSRRCKNEPRDWGAAWPNGSDHGAGTTIGRALGRTGLGPSRWSWKNDTRAIKNEKGDVARRHPWFRDALGANEPRDKPLGAFQPCVSSEHDGAWRCPAARSGEDREEQHEHDEVTQAFQAVAPSLVPVSTLGKGVFRLRAIDGFELRPQSDGRDPSVDALASHGASCGSVEHRSGGRSVANGALARGELARRLDAVGVWRGGEPRVESG